MTLNQAVGWSGSNNLSAKWNEELSLKNWQKRE